MIHQSLLSLMFVLTTAVTGSALQVGQKAPPFTAIDCDGHMFDLQQALSQGPVIVAFYPKAQTSGCTQEMRTFVSQGSMVQKYHAQIVAISRDDAKKLQTFRQELGASFVFLPDPDGALMRLYDSKYPVVTVAKRKTFVINQEGTIVLVTEGKDAIALKGIEEALSSLNKSSGSTK
jgi:peroxiredoxin